MSLDASQQAAAIRSLLVLRDDIDLPNPRATVPVMAELSERHPRLNLLNLEATASARVVQATILLSSQAAKGILPTALDAEGISWEIVGLT